MSTLEFNDALVNLEQYLKSFAYNYTRNQEDAEDLTQETMLKALKYRMQYTPQTNFKAWVFTIMRNVFINQYRRKVKGGTIFDNSKELYLLNNPTENHDNPSNHMTGLDLTKQMNKLEEEYKKPFKMHFDGYKYQEIADSLKIPIGTVKSRIFIARKKLMDFLPDYKYLAN
ncbi:MAG: RNA polymerase sigma factor [Flavobacteriia bacterium]|jgi:RNA polymerase sigma factor (sigma-70 family)